MDKKKFSKTVKPLLSDKTEFREKIYLTENQETLTFESETTETLNNFFANKTSKFNEKDSVTENIIDQSHIEIKNHPSIVEMQKYSKNKIFRRSKHGRNRNRSS